MSSLRSNSQRLQTQSLICSSGMSVIELDLAHPEATKICRSASSIDAITEKAVMVLFRSFFFSSPVSVILFLPLGCDESLCRNPYKVRSLSIANGCLLDGISVFLWTAILDYGKYYRLKVKYLKTIVSVTTLGAKRDCRQMMGIEGCVNSSSGKGT